MSSEFRKGQLVAVRAYSDEPWEPAIFERIEGNFFICRSLLNRDAWLERPWMKAKPAEDVWPDIFIGKERRVADQSLHAVEMASELVQSLRRQIRWLCRQINEVAFEFGRDYVCPPSQTIDKGCQSNCVACWEEASLKAVAEEEDDG